MNTSFKNYQYVLEYDSNSKIDSSFIKDALRAAWLETPSKNNFMPYKVHVLGTEFVKEKEELYWLCLSNETKANGNQISSKLDLIKYEQNMYLKNNGKRPAYHNIVSAPYVLIFTQRVEDKPNEFQQHLINTGYVYEQMATDGPNKKNAKNVARIEIGMFSTNFASICLNNGLDVSYTLCFPDDKDIWPEKYFNFLDDDPLLIITVGKGKEYRNYSNLYGRDNKPDFGRIVNIVKRK